MIDDHRQARGGGRAQHLGLASDVNQQLQMPADRAHAIGDCAQGAEIEQFKKDLLTSIRQMKKGEAARITKVDLPPAAMARASMGLSQAEFAALLGVSARTLQDWEQGRREPIGAVRTRLKVAVKYPKVLRELAA